MERKKTIKSSDTLNTNPRSDQYFTHALSHISRAVAASEGARAEVRALYFARSENRFAGTVSSVVKGSTEKDK